MSSYIIDVFKHDEMIRSIAGEWKDQGEACAMTAYYLGLFKADYAEHFS